MSEIIETPWMNVQQAASYMRRHPVSVRKDLEAGNLVGYQRKAPNGHWRIHRDDCDRFLRGESS